jgi:hypothetical protein
MAAGEAAVSLISYPGGLAPGAEPLVVCAFAGSQTFCSPSYTVFVQ